MPAKKAKTVYICQQCGHESLRWAGQCPECGEWNTLVEQIKETRRAGNALDAGGLRTKPQSLRDVNVDAFKRWQLPMEEFNRVLGGGIVPGSLVLIGGDPGIGKCLVGSTRVLDPTTGAYLPIRDWKHGLRPVLSLEVNAQQLSPQPVTAFLDQGVRPVVEVKTRLGRTLRCTATHPLLTPDGWQPVNALVPGSRIAAPRALPYFGSAAMPEHEVRLVAYLLSDGSATSSINVTTAFPEIEEDLARIAHAFGMKLSIYSKPNNRAKMIRFVQPLGERAEARKEISRWFWTHQAQTGLSWAAWARKANVSYGMIRHWRAGSAAPSAAELERLACAAHVSVDALAPAARNLAEMTTPVARFAESIGVRYATAKTKTVPDCIFRLPRQQLAVFLKILFSVTARCT